MGKAVFISSIFNGTTPATKPYLPKNVFFTSVATIDKYVFSLMQSRPGGAGGGVPTLTLSAYNFGRIGCSVRNVTLPWKQHFDRHVSPNLQF